IFPSCWFSSLFFLTLLPNCWFSSSQRSSFAAASSLVSLPNAAGLVLSLAFLPNTPLAHQYLIISLDAHNTTLAESHPLRGTRFPRVCCANAASAPSAPNASFGKIYMLLLSRLLTFFQNQSVIKVILLNDKTRQKADYFPGLVENRIRAFLMKIGQLKDELKAGVKLSYEPQGEPAQKYTDDVAERVSIEVIGGEFCRNGCYAYFVTRPTSPSKTVQVGAIIAKTEKSKPEKSVIHYIPDKAPASAYKVHYNIYSEFLDFLEETKPKGSTENWKWARSQEPHSADAPKPKRHKKAASVSGPSRANAGNTAQLAADAAPENMFYVTVFDANGKKEEKVLRPKHTHINKFIFDMWSKLGAGSKSDVMERIKHQNFELSINPPAYNFEERAQFRLISPKNTFCEEGCSGYVVSTACYPSITTRLGAIIRESPNPSVIDYIPSKQSKATPCIQAHYDGYIDFVTGPLMMKSRDWAETASGAPRSPTAMGPPAPVAPVAPATAAAPSSPKGKAAEDSDSGRHPSGWTPINKKMKTGHDP
ncbi:hypothetical protein BDP27DRAFT_1465069, partial [Rhodocollybia butyracea]